MQNPNSILLPYQQAWVADKSQVKICEKSRRCGISWAEAGDNAIYAAKASGRNVFYVGYNKDMARTYIEDTGWWAKQFQTIVDEVYNDDYEDILPNGDVRHIQAFVKFVSGHRVTALSSRPANLRSKQGRVVIDEAAFHDDLKGLIGAALALTMWGREIRIISTHNTVDSYFHELIEEIRAGKLKYSLHRIDLQTAVAQGLYQRICLTTGQEYSKKAEDKWVSDLYASYPAMPLS